MIFNIYNNEDMKIGFIKKSKKNYNLDKKEELY